MDDKKKVFVIMPFQDEFFEMLKMEFSEKYDFSNAGEEGNQRKRQTIRHGLKANRFSAVYFMALIRKAA